MSIFSQKIALQSSKYCVNFAQITYLQTYEYEFVLVSNNLWTVSLKGQCREIFNLYFFIKPIWVPDNRLKWFFLKIRFREDIRI